MGERLNTPTTDATGEAETFLTSSDVAAILSASPRSVDRWADTGTLKCHHRTPGGHRRFKPADVTAFITARTGQEGTPRP